MLLNEERIYYKHGAQIAVFILYPNYKVGQGVYTVDSCLGLQCVVILESV